MRETTCTLQVRFGETDAFGIVFYPNILMYFDVAVTSLLYESPYDFPSGVKNGGFGFPIVEASARFYEPLSAGDNIEITTRVTELRARSFRLEHTINCGKTRAVNGFEVRAFSRFLAQERRIVLAEIPLELHTWLLD